MPCVFRTKIELFMPFLRDISHFWHNTHVLPVPVDTLTNGDLLEKCGSLSFTFTHPLEAKRKTRIGRLDYSYIKPFWGSKLDPFCPFCMWLHLRTFLYTSVEFCFTRREFGIPWGLNTKTTKTTKYLAEKNNKSRRSFGNELTGARHRLEENVCVQNFGVYLSPINGVNFRLS